MSGNRFWNFLLGRAATAPTETDRFVRLDAETNETQVSTWAQMLAALDVRYPTASEFITHDGTILEMVRVTQAEYDALSPVATTFYVIIG